MKSAPQSSFCISGSSREKTGLRVRSNIGFFNIYLFNWLVLNCEALNSPQSCSFLLGCDHSQSSASSCHTRLAQQVATKVIVRLIITNLTNSKRYCLVFIYQGSFLTACLVFRQLSGGLPLKTVAQDGSWPEARVFCIYIPLCMKCS